MKHIINKPPDQGSLYDPSFEHDACGIGFVVDIKGRRTNEIIRQGMVVLKNLHHRGATGSEAATGDGAGITIQMPHEFLCAECYKIGIDLPAPEEYGVGMVFLPPDPRTQRSCEERFEDIVHREGQTVLGWRTVPTHPDRLGPTAQFTAPVVRQVFIKRSIRVQDVMEFERILYIIRKSAKREIRDSGSLGGEYYYVPSLSQKTIVYKGMLTADQLEEFYPDLKSPVILSSLALVHSRFSTNTFPSWDRAHPYRYMVHNGEINTLRGNINWFKTREKVFSSKVFGDNLPKVLPVLEDSGSDSAIFDNCLEFLYLAGRPIEEVMMMMIPEPWEGNKSMRDTKRAFYEYHSCLMEAWDGPAAIAFTDGTKIGAVLDRNGLRPGRYYVTDDDLVVMASECGVLNIAEKNIVKKGRLRPGRMLLVDTLKKVLLTDDEIKSQICTKRPYREWLDGKKVFLKDQPDSPMALPPDSDRLLLRQQVFGYTSEDISVLLGPMSRTGVEPLGAMGNDTPLAVLSDKPQPLFNYFHQLFAQVTNPPIDAIREELITSSGMGIGPEGNLLEPGPENCRQVLMDRPVLTNEELAKIKHIDRAGFRSVTLPILFDAAATDKAKALEDALLLLFDRAEKAIRSGADVLILSDREFTRQMAAIPSLLAVSGLHHYLINKGLRTRVGFILESGAPREVHHLATLVGYGVAGVNPYLALDSLNDMVRNDMLKGLDFESAQKNYLKALSKGLIKVLSKMGVSTVISYNGAQIFEAVGLKQSVVTKYFAGTSSRIEGIGLEEIAEETLIRHKKAYENQDNNNKVLDPGGIYKWRADGEQHQYNPQTIHLLQNACRTGDYNQFKEFSKQINEETVLHKTLRGLMAFKKRNSIPIDEVEPAASIVRRFKTGAMSYGSLSKEAHETLAIAMNRIGAKSNSGEGGEDRSRYIKGGNGDSKKSAIKQVASGRFGVTSEYLANSNELQIKIAQGAKPGEGGQLPGGKVYPWVAQVRNSTPGVGLISPPPHHDIYSIEDLAQLIHDLKNANPTARISVKLVSSAGVGTIAAGVAKARADLVLISGYDGGTGASPIGSIKHAGVPWELGLADTHQTLVFNDLRSRITVEVDGQVKTGRDVVIGALLGAEEFGFGTTALISIGCIMMRVCNLNTCPVGVATQDPELRKNFTGKPEHVINFMMFIAEEVREIMASLGIRKFDDLIGRTDLLTKRTDSGHWKAKGVNLSRILYKPDVSLHIGRLRQIEQDHKIEDTLDKRVLIRTCKSSIENKQKMEASFQVFNTDRVIGTLLGYEITRRYGAPGLPEDTINLNFKGSAGQSFGAFIPPGLTMTLRGDANDYCGKGLSGGKMIVRLPEDSKLVASANIIIGNVAFFGATSGEAYIQGQAGERFCVRNSGLKAVVEGVGDHGCEYMTGGCVVVLGRVGKNFAAGMSGGVAYVYDKGDLLSKRYNPDLVELETPQDSDLDQIVYLLHRHIQYTDSPVANSILDKWELACRHFVKVMPRDYKRVLETMKKLRAEGLSEEEVANSAFQANLQDSRRAEGR